MAVKKVSDAIKILRDDREKEDFETVKSFLKRLQTTIADQDKKLKAMADTLDRNCDLSEKLEDMSIAEAVKFLEDEKPVIEGEPYASRMGEYKLTINCGEMAMGGVVKSFMKDED